MGSSGRRRRGLAPGRADSAHDLNTIELLFLSFLSEGENLGLAKRVNLGLKDLDFVEGGRGFGSRSRGESGSGGLRRNVDSEYALI